MFNKIIFIIKERLEFDKNLINQLIEITENRETKFVKFEELKKSYLDDECLIIALGGDGTFIKAANLIEGGYIVGINTNPNKSEGALTSLDISNISRLKDILKGNFKTILRHRIKTRLNGKTLDELAINEVYLGAFSQFHISRYKIKYKGQQEEQRSSGVIISTGTGSPAWFRSAGGEIFKPDEEKISFIVREPYFGKRIFIPRILSGDLKKGEKIIIESKRNFGGLVAINENTYDFNQGDVVEIELSDKPLKTIKLK
jgi:NAD kinase